MSNRMSFGEWTAARIDANAGNHAAPARVVRVDAGFFNVTGLTHAAKTIDLALMQAQLEDRKLTPLETIAVEVLFAMAGWKDNEEAHQSYQRYLTTGN